MTLARALAAGRFQMEFACLRRWGPFVSELEARQVPLTEYRIATFRSARALLQQIKLARHIARQQIGIVHSYNFYGNVFAVPAARLAGAPVVIASIRDRGPYLTEMQKRVQRLVCRMADCVLVNARAVRDWLLADGYAPQTITVIPNGVDLSRFERRRNPQALRDEFHLPPGARLVAVVSRLNRLKGIEQFLEAAARVAVKVPDARFLIVGEPSPVWDRSYLDVLAGLARRLGIADRVVFTGLRSDVPALLASVEVSVMPSLNEALSNVLLESMASGAPVVATDVGGTTEALEHEVTGLVVPPDAPAVMSAAIIRLLEDPARAAAMGQAARQHIARHYSLDRMVHATESLYLELLAMKLRRPLASAPPRPSRAHRSAT
jgi:glycosyltransferase involved in cell wall biosynthesis